MQTDICLDMRIQTSCGNVDICMYVTINRLMFASQRVTGYLYHKHETWRSSYVVFSFAASYFLFLFSFTSRFVSCRGFLKIRGF